MVLMGLVVGWIMPAWAGNQASAKPEYRSAAAERWPQALRMADFILSLQNEAGAIRDEAGVDTVNQDSNMEYALIGLAAAYEATREQKYLTGLEKGIRYLAEREDVSDPRWKGSWYYVYSATPRFAHIATPPGEGKTDARGVDATSALFVYLLYLDQRFTGKDELVRKYSEHARAALDYVLRENIAQDGFSWSSYQQSATDGQWYRWAMKYSADQGDVYLGMRAAELLFNDPRYAKAATVLRTYAPARFFSPDLQRYGLGMDEKGMLYTDDDGNSAAFSQGYLAWMWGDAAQSGHALKWLQSKVLKDGSVVSAEGKPAFSLNVAMIGMAAKRFAAPEPTRSFEWLVKSAFDERTGAVRHSAAASDRHEYDNENGFCVISLLGFMPFVEGRNTDSEKSTLVRYLNISAPQVVMVGDQEWEADQQPHTMSVLELRRDGYRYWAWYGLNHGRGTGLARSNDLVHWTKFQDNPLWTNARWSSVLTDANPENPKLIYFAITRDYDTPTSRIVLATSEDGIHLVEVKDLVKPVPSQRNQNPNLFHDPVSGKFFLTYYRGNDRDYFDIVSRSAKRIEDLDEAAETVLLHDTNTIASPTLLYVRNGLGHGKPVYYLATEVFPDRYAENSAGDWQVKVFYSDKPDGKFLPTEGNPVERGERACLFQFVFGNEMYGFQSHLDHSTMKWVMELIKAPLP